MDKISVIVPVYKVEPYLRQCLDSVVGQTYKNLEIIVIDDGSPDNCGAICDEYAQKDARVRVVHKKNEGLCAARNDGIALATGDWIAFVDSDDWCELNMYEKAVNALEEGVDILIFSSFKNLGGGSRDRRSRFCSGVYDGRHCIDKTFAGFNDQSILYTA